MFKQQWGRSLAGLSGERIRRGLEECSKFDEPPTPAKFLEVSRTPEAHRPYVQPPAQSADGPTAQREIGRMRAVIESCRTGIDAIRAARKGTGKMRLILGPDYTQEQYLEDLKTALADAEPFYYVDMRAMAKWGWTEADEREHRRNGQLLGWTINMLYERRHEPPREVLDLDVQHEYQDLPL